VAARFDKLSTPSMEAPVTGVQSIFQAYVFHGTVTVTAFRLWLRS
jgi:hypothetical protein